MSLKKTSVTYQCGHTLQRRIKSEYPGDERHLWALQHAKCPDCEEAVRTAQVHTLLQLPPILGVSEAQIKFGEDIRGKKLREFVRRLEHIPDQTTRQTHIAKMQRLVTARDYAIFWIHRVKKDVFVILLHEDL